MMKAGKPHKHAALIKLWADGVLIEALGQHGWVYLYGLFTAPTTEASAEPAARPAAEKAVDRSIGDDGAFVDLLIKHGIVHAQPIAEITAYIDGQRRAADAGGLSDDDMSKLVMGASGHSVSGEAAKYFAGLKA